MTKPKTNPAPATVPTLKSRRLEVIGEPGKSEDRLMADLVAHGVAANASVAVQFVRPEHDELSLTDMVASLRERGEAINRGDLSAAERMLNAQAVALNAMFCELARRAAVNMGKHLSATESYVRLALKAQSQSRATIETLAAIKNPPVVFARQANINKGGQQQVNSGNPKAGRASGAASVRASELLSAPNELFEESKDGRTQLDIRATQATGRAHQDLAAVGTVNRGANT